MDDQVVDRISRMTKKELESLMHLSKLEDLMEMCEFMNDPELSEIIDLGLKLIASPAPPPEKAANLLIKFQSAGMKFAFQAIHYSTLKKGSPGSMDNFKKNIYYTAADQCDKLAASLKYLVRMPGQ